MKATDFTRKKKRGEKIVLLTCYDFPSAEIVADSHVDAVLVGDSVAMAVHGHPSTVMATLPMMVLHTEAVARGIGPQLLIADLPFLCHRLSRADTVNNVRQLMQAGAHAIKIEGADNETCETIAALVTAGIPVLGHLGLTPQSVHQLGGYKIQGKQENEATALLEQAHRLQAAGAVAVVLECIPESLARSISQQLDIPTIGIGAGAGTDGQVLVWHDMLGIQDNFHPKFLKHYAHLKPAVLQAINHYAAEVQIGSFPSVEYSYTV